MHVCGVHCAHEGRVLLGCSGEKNVVLRSGRSPTALEMLVES